jgi:hypothetical protein
MCGLLNILYVEREGYTNTSYEVSFDGMPLYAVESHTRRTPDATWSDAYGN